MKAKQKPSPYERVDRRSRDGTFPLGKGKCYVFAIAARFSTRI